MEDYYQRRHVPAFGSWDCYDDLHFTECFETARQAGLFNYRYNEDRDLYVAGDLYENEVVTPTMIVVPRRKSKVGHAAQVKDAKTQSWDCEFKETPRQSPSPKEARPAPKPVDEDLYKISPELLYTKSTKKRRGFFSSCFHV